MGTPEFAVVPLKNLIENGFDVVAVVTNKDKPVGRKQILTPPPVKVYAESKGIKVLQYSKIRAEGLNDLLSIKPDVIVTCAFGQILSQEIIDVPKLGVYNIHASLLPKYRGASPISFAILNGEKETGVTIMKTDVGIDTGDILLSDKIKIEDEDNLGSLSEKLSALGGKLILSALKIIETGDFALTKQDESLASYTKMIKKEDALIDFGGSAENIVNKIRAFDPSPVAYTLLNGEPFKIYCAKAVDQSGNAGEVLDSDGKLIVACGRDAISIEKVQKAGGKPMLISDFLRGNRIEKGFKFGV